MPLPSRLLSDGEEVVYESQQHWIALRDEIAYTLAWLVLWIIVVPWLDFALDEWIGWLLTLGWATLVGIGIARWYTTELSVTNKRLIYRTGVVEKSGYEVSLAGLADASVRESFWQGLAGAGDLLIDTGGHEAKTVINDVAVPGRLITVLEEAVLEQARAGQEQRRPPSRLPGEPLPEVSRATPPAPSPPERSPMNSSGSRLTRAEQLEILSRLHTDRKLTDEEFMMEKRRVLESD